MPQRKKLQITCEFNYRISSFYCYYYYLLLSLLFIIMLSLFIYLFMSFQFTYFFKKLIVHPLGRPLWISFGLSLPFVNQWYKVLKIFILIIFTTFLCIVIQSSHSYHPNKSKHISIKISTVQPVYQLGLHEHKTAQLSPK